VKSISKLILLFESTDIITTIIGVPLLGGKEINTIFGNLSTTLLVKTLVTVICVILIERLPFETDKKAMSILKFAPIIPLVCTVWNLLNIGVWLIWINYS